MEAMRVSKTNLFMTRLYSLVIISWSFPVGGLRFAACGPCWCLVLFSLLAFEKKKKKKKLVEDIIFPSSSLLPVSPAHSLEDTAWPSFSLLSLSLYPILRSLFFFLEFSLFTLGTFSLFLQQTKSSLSVSQLNNSLL